MPFVSHSKDAYTLALHHYYCLGQSAQDASRASGINATVVERCASGWSHGKDGRIGRAIFLWWMKQLRGIEGAPCCGAHVVPGRRRVPTIGPPAADLKKVEHLEDVIRAATEQVVRMRAAWGLTGLLASNEDRVVTQEGEGNDPDTPPLGGAT